MKVSGNLRKMRTALDDGEVQYYLPFYDVIEENEFVHMNELIGREISLTFENSINCVVTGKLIKKAYGEGMCWDAFRKSPMAVESIIRPELSRIHEGVALRDKEWEEEHHNKPHLVYLSLTGGIKVGVTRTTNVPFRWIDQGAVQAIKLAEVPYRQLAGLIEVEMKQHIADKTNWRQMLTNRFTNEMSLVETKEHLLDFLPEEYHDFVVMEDEITEIKYPVLEYPVKVRSIKFDKLPVIEKKLVGIKGQYMMFSDRTVINVRSHAGYCVSLEV